MKDGMSLEERFKRNHDRVVTSMVVAEPIFSDD